MKPDELGPTTPLAPAINPTSVYVFADLDDYERVMAGGVGGFVYARDGHPNARRLAGELARLEAAQWGLICGSGMAAISAVVLATVRAGDRVVIGSRLYGRTTTLFRQELRKFNVTTEAVDLCDLGAAQAALSKPARLVFAETMSNPLCRLTDVAALAELTHQAGGKLAVDNTFATPVWCRPLELGADFVVESLTKLIGGHSDVTLGAVFGVDPEMLPEVTRQSSVWGLSASPWDCWLAERGLATLPLRAKAAGENAVQLADWLAERLGPAALAYPGRPEHPDYSLAGRLLSGGYGNMLCFDVPGGRAGVNAFLRKAPGIPFSPSLGHTGTTCSHPASTSHRYDSPAELRRQGITEGLLRLSVGCEPFETIREELARGLAG